MSDPKNTITIEMDVRPFRGYSIEIPYSLFSHITEEEIINRLKHSLMGVFRLNKMNDLEQYVSSLPLCLSKKDEYSPIVYAKLLKEK